VGPDVVAQREVESKRTCCVRGQRHLTRRAQNALAQTSPFFLLSSAAWLLRGPVSVGSCTLGIERASGYL